jgi:NAD(P)-dependent dehydrogenase (short-subunit alcohol dehydrogenase family)
MHMGDNQEMFWNKRNHKRKSRVPLAFFILIFVSIPWALCAQEALPSSGQRVILITGSTGGLGRETALALAQAGDHVIIHGRNIQRAEEVLQKIEEDGNGSARFYRADFASLEETKGLAASILADYDRLDVLVNNAGVALSRDHDRQITEDGHELTFQVNYLAGYVLTSMLIPLLEKSAPSRVVNVASGQRQLDFDNLMLEKEYDGLEAYFRSKNAQIMMTYAMAAELSKRGISINALFPSALMDTDMVLELGLEPQSSVETGRDALLQLVNDEVGTGKFFNVFEVGEAIAQAGDPSAQQQLLKTSAELTSVQFLEPAE